VIRLFVVILARQVPLDEIVVVFRRDEARSRVQRSEKDDTGEQDPADDEQLSLHSRTGCR
jgi:hypothetical protein